MARVFDEVQIARRVDLRERRIEGSAAVVGGRAQRAHAAPLRRFVARHQPAMEHFFAALVQVVKRVVDRQHGRDRPAQRGLAAAGSVTKPIRFNPAFCTMPMTSATRP